MYNVTITLYSFNELTEKAKQKAIEEHATFLTETYEEYQDISREDVIESIEANNYIFFEDGSIAHCTTYIGKHEKTGITEFHFHGRNYIL